MANKVKDLTGLTFGYLTVLARAGSAIGAQNWTSKRTKNGAHHGATWLCRCFCGTEVVRQSQSLQTKRRQNARHCGCLLGQHVVTHGLTSTPIWHTWNGMRARCGNQSGKDWKNYGARGIAVCDRWQHSFMNFLEDMGGSYVEGLSLDRIDNSKGYSPDNCRWATRSEQANNTRNNIVLDTPQGRMTVTQAAKAYGLRVVTLHARIFRYQWPVEIALTTPVRRRYSTSSMPENATALP